MYAKIIILYLRKHKPAGNKKSLSDFFRTDFPRALMTPTVVDCERVCILLFVGRELGVNGI